MGMLVHRHYIDQEAAKKAAPEKVVNQPKVEADKSSKKTEKK